MPSETGRAHRGAITALAVMVLTGVSLGLAGCAGSRPDESQPGEGSAVDAGVFGVAVVDAGCPVLDAGTSCPDVPLRARVVVLRSTDRVAVTETDPKGRFRAVLPPGSYVLHGENLDNAAVPSAMPISVTVHPGEFTEVTIRFDSGIRGVPGS